jgi:hypothetical protein
LLLGGVVDFGELESGARIRERGDGGLHDLSLELEFGAKTVDELERQIAIVDRTTDRGQIIGNALKLAGVGGDVKIAARGGAEGLAEEEVSGGLVVDEEAHEPGPSGAGAAISARHEPVEVVAQGPHKPQRYVDVHGHPEIVGNQRSRTFGDVIQRFVHGEEEGDDLPPLGEVFAGGGDLKLDIVGDVDVEDGVGGGHRLVVDERRRG